MSEKHPFNRPDYSLLARLLSLGSGIFALALLGYWLDQKFHTILVWTTIGAVLGVLYCFYEAWRVYKEK